MSKLGQSLYTGAATVGRVRAWIGAIVGSAAAAGLIVYGGSLALKPDPYDSRAMGTLKQVHCVSYVQKGRTYYKCKGIVSFVAKNGKTYQVPLVTDSTRQYRVNETLQIEYKSASPQEARPSPFIHRPALGALLMGAGVLVGAFSWLTLYLARRYKFFAAAEGVEGLSHLLR